MSNIQLYFFYELVFFFPLSLFGGPLFGTYIIYSLISFTYEFTNTIYYFGRYT